MIVNFAAISELLILTCCTVVGGQTKVRNYNEKERFDIRNCYKCFYQCTWLFIMGWLIASWSIQIVWLVDTNELKEVF